jgi:hypothetical protein
LLFAKALFARRPSDWSKGCPSLEVSAIQCSCPQSTVGPLRAILKARSLLWQSHQQHLCPKAQDRLCSGTSKPEGETPQMRWS